jgi:hypothetical protein
MALVYIVVASGPNKWKPPEQGRYKMNVACRFSPPSALTGVGVLIRKSNGLVTAAFCTNMMITGDSLQAQAQAVLIGLQFAQNLLVFGGLKWKWDVKILSD